MRVLHVISGDLWAGAEAQACTLLTSLRGLEGVEVAAAVMNEGELSERLRRGGVAVTVLPERELGAATIAYRLRALMLGWRPDLVHTHRLKENILGSMVNATSIRVPSLRTVHGAREHSARGVLKVHKRALLALERFCGRHLQRRIVAVSRDLAAQLTAEYDAASIVVIENGIDIEATRSLVRPVEFRQARPTDTHVGLVGRLVPVKRPDLFLHMASSLRRANPERQWRFHLFGDGPLRASLSEQARALGLADITEFHGHRADVISCMAALDLLVMCSDHEGLPMALLEALAVGTPVVVHAVGGIPEVINGYEGGRTVQSHTAEGYAQAAMDLLRSQTVGVGPDLSAHIAEHYSAGHNARRVYELYRTLIGEAA